MKKNIVFLLVLLGQVIFHAQSPLCSAEPTSFCCEYVSDVTINGVSSPGANNFTPGPGYFDYTGSVLTTLIAGQTYPISITVETNSTYQEYVKMWFDFNGNSDLSDVGELVYDDVESFNGTFVFSGNVTVPMNAFNGDIYIRVVMTFANSPQLCGPYSYGTTLDFRATITGGVASNNLTVTNNLTGEPQEQ